MRSLLSSRVALATLVLATAAATSAAAQKNDDPDRKEAIRLLFRSRREPPVRQGAQLCLQKNDVEYVELLLKVLNGLQPHYRDIVWEVLPDFTDPYVRRRIANELRQNKRNENVRHWCAELLGIYGDADWVPYLLAAMRDKHPPVVRAATRSLGMIGHASAAKVLEKASRAKDIYVRANAIESLVRIDAAAYLPKLLDGLGDKDGGVRCALLGALPQLVPGRTEELSTAALADADWRPRMQAVDNLAALRTKGGVAALITALDDPRPAVRVRTLRFLQSLTGQKFRKRIEWDEWWRDHAAEFAFADGNYKPTPADQATRAVFNGIRIDSDQVAFLLDGTPTMDAALVEKRMSKRQAAHKELDQAMGGLLDTGLTFNVGVYGDEVKTLAKRPLKLSKKTHASALKFVAATDFKGHKNIWNALLSVLEDPNVDTVFLLSSGEPEVGLYVHWNRVTRHLQELNRFHKKVVHTVVYSDSDWYREQLQKIADVTGGTFQAFL